MRPSDIFYSNPLHYSNVQIHLKIALFNVYDCDIILTKKCITIIIIKLCLHYIYISYKEKAHLFPLRPDVKFILTLIFLYPAGGSCSKLTNAVAL